MKKKHPRKNSGPRPLRNRTLTMTSVIRLTPEKLGDGKLYVRYGTDGHMIFASYGRQDF